METRDITLRLHDILRAAYRVRLPGPASSAETSVQSIDVVKAGLRGLLADLGDRDPPRLPPQMKASAAAIPEGRIPGTRILVQHRRRGRVLADAVGQPARKPAPTLREAAERLFRPVVIAGGLGRDPGPGLVS